MKVPGTFTASIVTVAEMNDLENVRAYASAPTGAELRDCREFVDPNTRLRWIWSDSEAAWVSSGPVDGALISWTPIVDQGASTNISKSSTYAVYSRQGRQITATFRVVMSASGTAGGRVAISFPVAPASNVTSNLTDVGSFVNLTGAGFIHSHIAVAGIITDRFVGARTADDTNAYFGTATTIASGTIITGKLSYEAAA